jgi:uncharacterized protein YodC (DUF2158 family)
MENETKFKPGDIVLLKSDALDHFPTYMTVNEVEMGKVTCVWSVEKHEFRERSFSPEALQLYKG